MEPRFIHLAEKNVVGLGATFISALSADKNHSEIIGALWHNFIQRQNEVKCRVNQGAIGLVEMLPEKQKSHPSEMFYIAGAEVSNLQSPPAGMLSRVVPAGKYAVFVHTGILAKLPQTMKEIYEVWVPKSGVQLRDAPHLEIYDHRFKLNDEASEFEILLPIE